MDHSEMLGRKLLMLAEAITPALGGDDAGVSDAIDTVRTLIVDPELLDALPEPLETADASVEAKPVEPVTPPVAEPAAASEEPLDDIDVHIETVEQEVEIAQDEDSADTTGPDEVDAATTTEIESASSDSIEAPARESETDAPASQPAADASLAASVAAA